MCSSIFALESNQQTIPGSYYVYLTCYMGNNQHITVQSPSTTCEDIGFETVYVDDDGDPLTDDAETRPINDNYQNKKCYDDAGAVRYIMLRYDQDCTDVGFTDVYQRTSYCGNNVREGKEECDGTDVQYRKCKDLGKAWNTPFVSGQTWCTSRCTYSTNDCKFNRVKDCEDIYYEGQRGRCVKEFWLNDAAIEYFLGTALDRSVGGCPSGTICIIPKTAGDLITLKEVGEDDAAWIDTELMTDDTRSGTEKFSDEISNLLQKIKEMFGLTLVILIIVLFVFILVRLLL